MAWVVGAFSIYGAVVMGVGGAPVLHLLGEMRPKPHTPLDAMRNSSVESSLMARNEDGVSLWVQPMKAVPESPLLRERLKPLK
jgi:hypothetical protein